jgi:hypothetical protein
MDLSYGIIDRGSMLTLLQQQVSILHNLNSPFFWSSLKAMIILS